MTRPRILLIDDHRDYREATSHFLKLHGLQADLIEACSGEEGVFLAAQKKPDIVVIDFLLGGMDGLDAARQIKKCLSKCSIIMLTIYDPEEISVKDKQGAINFFINKGDLCERLVPAIKKILDEIISNR